jgi:hypothetical protein
MSLVAKSVVKNKFWIVEEGGNKVATIQKNEQDVVWVSGHQRQKFPNIDLLKNHYNIVFDKPTTRSKTVDDNCYGYPTDSRPYNSVWDIKNQVPLYTQERRSKCYYAAGWYVLDNEVVFCPKSIFINRNKFSGPYRTQEEAQHEQNIIDTRSTKIL